MTNISLNVTTTFPTSKHIDFSAWIQSSKVKLNVIHHMVDSEDGKFYTSKNTDLPDLSLAESAYLKIGDTLEIVLNNRNTPYKTTPIAFLRVEHVDVRPVVYDGIPLLDSEERQEKLPTGSTRYSCDVTIG